MFFPHLGIQKGATFSPCRKYRYTLWRIWNAKLDHLAVIGLNPSTADESKDDPTIRRCIKFARDWEFGGLYMLNAFAFRATDPKDMKAADEPIGPGNDESIRAVCEKAGMILAAWGVDGGHLNRDKEILAIIKRDKLKLHCLGVSKEGFPLHPLWIPASTEPVIYHGRS